MSVYREEEMNTSPLNQEMFDLTPSPFSVRAAWILTQRMVLWGTSLYCLSLLAF